MASRTIEEHEADLTALRARATEIHQQYQGEEFPENIRAEWDQVNTDIEAKNELVAELRAREDRVRAFSADPGSTERGAHFNVQPQRSVDIWDTAAVRAQSTSVEQETRMLNDNAQRAVETMQFPHEGARRESCQAAIERLQHKFGEGQRGAEFNRHILATGSPHYRRAFAKAISGALLTTEEQRSLSLTSGSGGYAVPVVLDPTIIPTSNGAVNPWRAISRVEQITGSNTWNGVSSGAVVASRDLEFEEVSDDAPTLAQPTATVTKAQAFIPFSIEVGQDWGSLESEMATLIQDAKDTEEATAFATGAGTGVNPQGVLTGATGTVAAGTAAFAVAHAYALLEALPARFRPNAKFVANLAQYNRIRQLDTSGGASLWTENLQVGVGNNADGQTGYSFLGKPAYESSVMASVLTAASKIMIFGDFRYFLIVDRIGMTVEVVPHLFGATNQRPIGARGLLAYWRNTSRVLSTAAFKTLVTT